MQFSVPQFTEVEDRLIGSLTLKQFLVLLGTGAIILFFWTILGPSIIFFLFSLPIAVVGIGAAMGKYNGRPMFAYLLPFAAFVTSNKVMVFKREPVIVSVAKAPVKIEEKPKTPDELEPTDSRLKKLAYMLERKTEEEKELLNKQELNVLKATSSPKIDMNQFLNGTRAKFQEQVAEIIPSKTLKAAEMVAEPRIKAGSPLLEKPLIKKRAKGQPSQPAKQKQFDPSSFIET
ncbi:MAG: PrgI family protein [Candidatus Doudnabacteria bacterium]|nr:PrgI family protein [Candidatus Doudnabacteria bacterium]